MKPLLILPQKHRPDDADLWRAAVRRGWETLRIGARVDAAILAGRPLVRYYGNSLHALQVRDALPVSFSEIDPPLLTELPVTRRRITLQRFAELVQPLAMTCFIKPTSEKWFTARVYAAGEALPEGPLSDDLVYVQDPVCFTDEIRCFVRGPEILTASLYRIGGVVWDDSGLPPELINYDERLHDTPIPEMVRTLRATTSNRLPEGVVMDFGRLTSGEWALVEFNEAWASGIYYCDPDRALDAIVASQASRQPAPQ